jgi:hypothetical protein
MVEVKYDSNGEGWSSNVVIGSFGVLGVEKQEWVGDFSRFVRFVRLWNDVWSRGLDLEGSFLRV